MLLSFLFILGLAVGSFLNVCIDRLPKNKSLMGRSHCDFCKKKLQARDLIPVISFFLLNRKCRYCRKDLSWYYPSVELLTAFIFVLVWTYTPVPNAIVRIAIIGIFAIFAGIFFADLKYQIIPDEFQVALLFFGIVLAYFTGANLKEFGQLAVNGLIVMIPMYLLYLITNGKGLGFGDVKLSFVIGFLFGTIGGFIALYLGFVMGAIVGIFLLLSGKKRWKSKIAFGPFLVLGSMFMLLFGHELVQIAMKFYPF